MAVNNLNKTGVCMIGEPIINPERLANEVEIKSNCLFLINPSDAAHRLKSARKRKEKFFPIFHSNLWTEGKGKKEVYCVGPAVGAPMAIMTMEKVIALGCTTIMVYGWCGAISPELKIGDILIPTWGEIGEGTSQYYQTGERPRASESLAQQTESLLKGKGLKCQQGPIWTTDAPYREGRELLASKRQAGLLAVDMEFTAMANLAIFRNIEMASVFIVSDELYHEKWQPGFYHKDFKARSRQIVNILNSNLYRL